ncbi:hypothetical protein N7532_000632 [Penicillium argentinense]|uniref:Uncharacterized protein n=1 Tax=Penicillium argentinense TaxID=1131581 RepID=A0A9W9G5W9_9EURO|nr:uncharacterized protein N7532_000632 [Penicillium argentinense]KAJ5112587.1 hypothetical protein N7532_000632 [Penicillium argentinense]
MAGEEFPNYEFLPTPFPVVEGSLLTAAFNDFTNQEAGNFDWDTDFIATDSYHEPETAAGFSDNLNDWCLDSAVASCPIEGHTQHDEILSRHSQNSQLIDVSHSLVSTWGCGDSEEAPLSETGIPMKKAAGGGAKRRRIPAHAANTLRSWLYQHQSHPYPTEQERVDLEQQTGLNKRQILTWFTNARRRKLPRNFHPPEGDSTNLTSLSPLERWQYSPPETEPAATSDILRALQRAPEPAEYEAIQRGVTTDPESSNGSSTSFTFGAPSISSCEYSHSSGSDASFQAQPCSSLRPPTPIPSMRSRRHRRKTQKSKLADQRALSQKRTYQCTFCAETFRSKYDWQRHEKALHLSVDHWSCAPEGGIIQIQGTRICVFCLAENVDDDHLKVHNYLFCREKDPQARQFSRKDHLRQHLRLVHGVSCHPSMDRWRYTMSAIKSRCGFCEAEFVTWEERGDHLAEHFKGGADMNQWKGGWGFEPEIESLVENAIPPFLLGLERRTMDPWKISNMEALGEGEWSLNNDVPNAFNRYTNLRQAMVDYLQEQVTTGEFPPDEVIQDHARLIAYGDTDPWNQTWADDPRWLTTLKDAVCQSQGLANAS